MSNEMIAAIVAAVLVALALWSPLLFTCLFAFRALTKFEAILAQGKQTQARLDGLASAITASEAAADRRATGLGSELRAARGTVEQAARGMTGAAAELVLVVKAADGSFRHLADSMRDLDNLQQMSGHVERLANETAGASAKIESQLETAGKVVEALHDVVDAWSKERAPIEAQTAALAREVEKALNFERDERQQLRLQLNALLVRLATADGGPDART